MLSADTNVPQLAAKQILPGDVPSVHDYGAANRRPDGHVDQDLAAPRATKCLNLCIVPYIDVAGKLLF